MRVSPLSRALPLAALAALALAGCTDGASLAPRTPSAPRLATTHGNQTITETPVTFSLPNDPGAPGSVCGLPARVDGTGILRTVVKTVETGAGRVRLSISATASGTARGTDGSTYTWTYMQRVRFFDVANLPTTIRVTDQFHLRGQNGAPSYKTMFHLNAVLDENGNVVDVEFTKDRGDSGQCDPI
jgi:hypothetical protein